MDGLISALLHQYLYSITKDGLLSTCPLSIPSEHKYMKLTLKNYQILLKQLPPPPAPCEPPITPGDTTLYHSDGHSFGGQVSGVFLSNSRSIASVTFTVAK